MENNRTIDLELVIKEVFKEYLINNKEVYKTWKIVNSDVQHIILEKGINYTLSKDYLRNHVFKNLIETDYEWVIENGVPVSLNARGVKISDHPDEIANYIKGERTRAFAILQKVHKVKNIYTGVVNYDNYGMTNPQMRLFEKFVDDEFTHRNDEIKEENLKN